MKSKLFFLSFLSLLIAGCYSSKLTTYQLVNSADETWQVKVEKSGMLPVIKVIVNDSEEILLDDSKISFKKIIQLQPKTRLSIYENQTHVWLLDNIQTEQSQKAIREIATFLKD